MPEKTDATKTRDRPIAELELLATLEAAEARVQALEVRSARWKKLALIFAAPFILVLSPVVLPIYAYNRRRKGKPLFGSRPKVEKVVNPRVVDARRMVEVSGRRSDVPPPVLDAAQEADMAARPDTFVLYRIIGNDLVPRHAHGQSFRNVEFILRHEPAFENCEKRWILNRVFDDGERSRIKALLEEHGQKYSEIPFSWEEYAGISYDFSRFPKGFFSSKDFEDLTEDEKIRARVMSYRLKNNYVMNNNGARNFAIEEGRALAKWVLPWDGNCFVTQEAWEEISDAIRSRSDLRYLAVPMARITDNADLLEAEFRPDAREEPQVVFRADATERFDTRHAYGRRPKVELLLRLGVEGPWEKWRLDPWDEPPGAITPEAHRVGEAGWVARLFSGAALGEQSTMQGFKHRGRLREEAIVKTIDLVDELALNFLGYSPDKCLFYDEEAVRGLVATRGPSWRDAIVARADEALRRGLFTVVDKTTLPPSGDARDYWHPAPYWWPNDRSADGLPYVKRDGERVPGTELFGPGNEKYDRTRLQHLFDDVTFLAIAWSATGEAAYRTHALNLIRGWFIDPDTRMNPSLTYAQVRMGHDGNSGQSWGIIESKDMYYFLDAVRLLGDTEEMDGLRVWVREFLSWMKESPQGISESRAANNHGTCYDLQVTALAAFVGDRPTIIESWHRAQGRIPAQIQDDGFQPEEMRRTLTQHYCAFNLQCWINLLSVLEALGIRPWSAAETALVERAATWFLSESEGKWRHRQIAEFDARRRLPVEDFALRRGLVEKPGADIRREGPTVFHPDDGIAPLWELARSVVADRRLAAPNGSAPR